MHIDSFSGEVVDLKPKQRTPLNLLKGLQSNPLISTWDFSMNRWLDLMIQGLEEDGLIKPVPREYPWHQYEITEQGNNFLSAIEITK